MLAGWAAPPPDRVPAAPLACFAPDALGPQWRDRKVALVFVVGMDAKREQGDAWPMYSALVRLGPTSGDGWYPARDPSEVLDELTGGTNAVKGLFRLVSRADRTPEAEVRFEAGAPGFEKLTRMSAVPRVPASGAAGTLTADWSVRRSPKPPPGSLAEPAHTWWQARGAARQAARENFLNRIRTARSRGSVTHQVTEPRVRSHAGLKGEVAPVEAGGGDTAARGDVVGVDRVSPGAAR
jgi:hypothetical protein